MIEDTVRNAKLKKTEDIIAAWKSHFSTLLNRPTDVNWTRIHGVQQHEIITRLDDRLTMIEL